RVARRAARRQAERRVQRTRVAVVDVLAEAEGAVRFDEVNAEVAVDEPDDAAGPGVELDPEVLALEHVAGRRHGGRGPAVDERVAAVADRRDVAGDERQPRAARPVALDRGLDGVRQALSGRLVFDEEGAAELAPAR